MTVPLSQRLWRCPEVSPAPCAWNSPAAAASFPGTEPSLLWRLLYSDLGGRDGGGRWGNVVFNCCDIFEFLHILDPQNDSCLQLRSFHLLTPESHVIFSWSSQVDSLNQASRVAPPKGFSTCLFVYFLMSSQSKTSIPIFIHQSCKKSISKKMISNYLKVD